MAHSAARRFLRCPSLLLLSGLRRYAGAITYAGPEARARVELPGELPWSRAAFADDCADRG